MYILKFKVDKQYITRIDNEKPVGKCRNLFKAHFDFVGNEWSGTKTAIFKNEKVSKSVIIDESNECVVPWEFFNLKTTSIGLVSVFCGDLVTANAATVVIYESGYTDSDASVPPSPDVYQQILEKIDSISGLTTEDIKKAVEEYLTENPIIGEAREIELRKTETAIQWRYVGEDIWKDLVKLSEISGKDGATPEIGQDGNWYINGQDTGEPSRGENATDEQVQQAVDTYMQGVDFDAKIREHNKSTTAHEDIREEIDEIKGGLTGKLDKYQGIENEGKILGIGTDGLVVSVEKLTIPTKLPNPHKLTFNGAVTAEYDGSGAVTVTIPQSGTTERIEKLASDTTIELEPNKLYIFPEMENLTYTLKEPADKNSANEYHFVFQTGASPTQVVHPLGIKIGTFSVEENKIYEVSIMENLLTSQSWAVV